MRLFPPSPLRRTRAAALAVVLLTATGCEDDPTNPGPTQQIIDDATIELFRPTGPTESITAGLHPLGLSSARDGFLYVPAGYNASTKAPLLVLLHGAGGSSADWDTPELRTQYDANGMIVLAIDSRYDTWDAIVTGEYNVDVDFLQDALEYAYRVANIDGDRMGIGGFSDGASEALGMGLANAHLFTRIVSFSAGFLYAPFSRGTPQVYMTHGQFDTVIPFEQARTNIMIPLVQNGHQVHFHQFAEGHIIPEQHLLAALQWAASSRVSAE